MIQVRELEVRFGDRVVVSVPELEVPDGSIIGIAGESGSGKSQTALAMIGLTGSAGGAVSGSITFEGRELTTLSAREWSTIRGRRIAMIMQSPRSALNPTMRLGSVFARTLRQHGVPRSQLSTRMEGSLREVLLDPQLLRRFPHEISGGQAQRFSIALTLALGAKVILADEPTSALDVTVQAEVLELLRRVREQHGTSIVFISHDLAAISSIADQVYVMKSGQVVESGPTERVLNHPAQAYTQELLAAVPQIGRHVTPTSGS